MIRNYSNYLLRSTCLVFLLGSIFHFLYDISGNQWIFGIVFPNSESIWEHLKLCYLPILIVWLLPNTITAFPDTCSRNQMVCSAALSLTLCSWFIASAYYFFACGLQIHSLPLDLILYAIGIFLGQLHGIHLSRKLCPYRCCLPVCIIYLILLSFLFALWSYNPPAFSLFS